jgi:alpha-L-fucosidase
MNIGAYFYNRNLATRGGKMEAVLNIKGVPDRIAKGVVADYERGVTDQIKPFPWQSETCIGEWHYARSRYANHSYMKPGEVIHWLADAVSKNGTFILNIPGRPDGTNDPDEIAILEAIGRWMDINGEAIYSTRPWKIYGEGPHAAKGGAFAGESTSALDGRDVRYTRSKYGGTVYAIVLGWPEGDQIRLTGLAGERVGHVDVLGSAETLTWEAGDHALTVGRPAVRPSDYAVVFRVRLA